MIEKIRNNDIAFLDSRYTVDKFHNPYLSKFTLKLTPATIDKDKTSGSYSLAAQVANN